MSTLLGSSAAILCAGLAVSLLFLTGHVPAGLKWTPPWMARLALLIMFAGGAAFALSGGGVTVTGWIVGLIHLQPELGWGVALLATVVASIYVAFKLLDIFTACPHGAVYLAGIVPLLLSLWAAGWLHTWYEQVVIPAGPAATHISQTISGHG